MLDRTVAHITCNMAGGQFQRIVVASISVITYLLMACLNKMLAQIILVSSLNGNF